jgi:hypothetical protein
MLKNRLSLLHPHELLCTPIEGRLSKLIYLHCWLRLFSVTYKPFFTFVFGQQFSVERSILELAVL